MCVKVVESCKVRMRKPERRIYEHALRALNVSPTEAVFLDDLGVNLKAASELGIRTIKVPASCWCCQDTGVSLVLSRYRRLVGVVKVPASCWCCCEFVSVHFITSGLCLWLLQCLFTFICLFLVYCLSEFLLQNYVLRVRIAGAEGVTFQTAGRVEESSFVSLLDYCQCWMNLNNSSETELMLIGFMLIGFTQQLAKCTTPHSTWPLCL